MTTIIPGLLPMLINENGILDISSRTPVEIQPKFPTSGAFNFTITFDFIINEPITNNSDNNRYMGLINNGNDNTPFFLVFPNMKLYVAYALFLAVQFTNTPNIWHNVTLIYHLGSFQILFDNVNVNTTEVGKIDNPAENNWTWGGNSAFDNKQAPGTIKVANAYYSLTAILDDKLIKKISETPGKPGKLVALPAPKIPDVVALPAPKIPDVVALPAPKIPDVVALPAPKIPDVVKVVPPAESNTMYIIIAVTILLFGGGAYYVMSQKKNKGGMNFGRRLTRFGNDLKKLR